MRNIIFKAKTESGRWIEGDLIHYESGEMAIVEKPFSKYGMEATEIARRTEVIPETVCQYTGLTDKNGNKIWENDVVRCYADTDDLGNDLYFFYQILWHELYHCWWLSDIHTLEDEYLHQYIPSNIEVIGNIFDNPELMKEGK